MITVKQLLSFLLLSMFSVVTMAQEEEEIFVDNGIKYTVTSPTTVAVKGRGENKAEKLVIPEKVRNYTVSAIADWAFFFDSDLQGISIPKTVTSIEERAFYGCRNLSEIQLPENLTELGEAVFTNCQLLKKVHIPAGVTVLKDNLFMDCSELTEVTVGPNVTKNGINCVQWL